MATGFTPAVKTSLDRAVRYAADRGHEFVTLEHVLLSLTSDADVLEVLGSLEGTKVVLVMRPGEDVPEWVTNVVLAEDGRELRWGKRVDALVWDEARKKQEQLEAKPADQGVDDDRNQRHGCQLRAVDVHHDNERDGHDPIEHGCQNSHRQRLLNRCDR